MLNERPFVHSQSGLGVHVQFACPMDAKACFTMTGTGGGSAVAKHPCAYCDIPGEQRGTESLYPCVDCSLDPGRIFPCMHRDFVEGRSHDLWWDAQVAEEAALIAEVAIPELCYIVR
jgi:hypothetical protein